MSSVMSRDPDASERLRGRLSATHELELRGLGVRARRQPLPLVPLLHGLCKPARRDQGVPEPPVRRRQQRVEVQGAPQLVRRVPRPAGGELDASEQQVDRRVVGIERGGLLRLRPRAAEVLADERVLVTRSRLADP